jgi:hypothetical protein
LKYSLKIYHRFPGSIDPASIRQETFHFNPFLLVGIHILPSTDEGFADQKTGKHFKTYGKTTRELLCLGLPKLVCFSMQNCFWNNTTYSEIILNKVTEIGLEREKMQAHQNKTAASKNQ